MQLDAGSITIGVPSGFEPFDPVTCARRRMMGTPLSSVSARLIDGEKKRREFENRAPTLAHGGRSRLAMADLKALHLLGHL